MKILAIICLVIWLASFNQALRDPMSGAIEAMKDGYGGVGGVVCFLVRFGLPILAVILFIV